MKIITNSFSAAGPKKSNQDATLELFSFDNGYAIAIADGIGGKNGGAVASNAAINELKRSLENTPNASMFEHFEYVDRKIKEMGKEDASLSEMGTTLSVCIISGNTAKVGHVGDTRIYHLRNEGLQSRTIDQTEVQHLIDKKILNKERAKKYDRRNVLLSSLSASSSYQFQETSFSLLVKDRLILLTDGVYNLVPRHSIKDISITSTTPNDFCINLKEVVENVGPKDDYSAICVDITD